MHTYAQALHATFVDAHTHTLTHTHKCTGTDYMGVLGPDLAFLDSVPFLRNRLTFTRAAEDPFLVEVTPDGIPIEEATTCDLRRGRLLCIMRALEYSVSYAQPTLNIVASACGFCTPACPPAPLNPAQLGANWCHSSSPF
jgi:hypothetical protein